VVLNHIQCQALMLLNLVQCLMSLGRVSQRFEALNVVHEALNVVHEALNVVHLRH
jgi:hypothetical protein